MTDPIIEAAARALTENSVPFTPMIKIAEAVVAAVTPRIEAAALERAARLAEEHYNDGRDIYIEACTDIAAAIRAMIAKDSGSRD